ncbi:hypothetical protein MCOR27_004165 [Pyricularia oryzae]|uniref:Uncharacterized protein n=2 Tax=Pyricularia TaxID=48558 RepID=A0ABQ8N6P3_PYRGI|nr:hypothetical protein MCOR01_001977 [Pyricularia oryzae]KAI6292147.1 hypothetical protein MCOR33_010069 [Pyricularia grisea]KAH9429449.1 hypothetical protein MCOR02_010852 [Pyricularia oryzae]KAI6257835.1 hypothetical protein MCOR19_005780 [Pyricularia oryzae]KAI6272919.1 hypothetical protein MCOR26_007149 [Pyricularia oryzae]
MNPAVAASIAHLHNKDNLQALLAEAANRGAHATGDAADQVAKMTGESKVWLDTVNNTVEGHTSSCKLFFNDSLVWETGSCHDNTVKIQTALRQADPRFELRMAKKDGNTVEGHTRKLNIKYRGETILKDHSCHDNMEGMASVINNIWSTNPAK